MPNVKTRGKGKKARYVVRYDGPRDPSTGERVQKQKSFKTSKEAEEFRSLVSLNSSQRTNFPFPNMEEQNMKESVPFHTYVENWFETDYYQQVRASTFKKGRFFLNKHIFPFFEDKMLDEITSKDIIQFYALKKKERYADKTISGIHKFLSKIFQDAVDNDALTQHPMQGIKKKPRDPVRICQPWSYSEIAKFLGVAEGEGKGLIYDFTLSTGLRLGEVLTLPWFALNFDHGTVTVTQSISYDEEGKPELFVKSTTSYRTLSLPKDLIEKLKEHREQQEEIRRRLGKAYSPQLNLVFPNMKGGYLNPSNVRRQMYKLMDKAGVRRIKFHDLRHTHASLLIRNGAHPKIVMGRLGHKDVETTIRFYAHLWPNADQEAINVLEKEMTRHRKINDRD